VVLQVQLHYWHDNVRLFTRTIAFDPENDMAHNNLASHLLKSAESPEEFDRIRQHLEQATLFNPRNDSAWLNLAEVERRQGNPQEAVHHLQRGMVWDPFDPSLNGFAAIILEQMGRYEEALQHARIAAQSGTGDPQLAVNVARLEQLAARGAIQEAPAPESPMAKVEADVMSLLNEGREKDAVDSLKEALASDPTWNGGRELLAGILANANSDEVRDPRGALAQIDQLEAAGVSLSPGHWLIQARCHADLGEAGKAEAIARAILASPEAANNAALRNAAIALLKR